MTREPNLESYLDALREDLPSAGTEARMQQRLAGMTIGVSVALATKTAAATCAAPAAKVGLLSALSARFAELPLLWQMGLVTATTAVVTTGPLVVMTEAPSARNHPTVQVEHRGSPRTYEQPARGPIARETTRAQTVTSFAEMPRAETTTQLDDPPAEATKGATFARSAPGARSAERRIETASPGADSPELRSLADETRIIDRALASIREGKLRDAERQLDEHDQRFPQGRLKREQRRAREKLEEARLREDPSTSN